MDTHTYHNLSKSLNLPLAKDQAEFHQLFTDFHSNVMNHDLLSEITTALENQQNKLATLDIMKLE